jgi:hypothetical protein
MFARKVTARLKPNSLSEFANLMEHEILPWLKTQRGFLDLIILAAPGGGELTTISFWDQQADADAYHSSGYPEVIEILERLLDDCPYVKTFDVVSSTFRRAVARASKEEALHGSSEGPFDARAGLEGC